jgi:hypothetical protein
MTTKYEIPEAAPRQKCRECQAEIAFVKSHTGSGMYIPVRVSTGESHFADCPNPARFSRKAKLAAARAQQKELFE